MSELLGSIAVVGALGSLGFAITALAMIYRAGVAERAQLVAEIECVSLKNALDQQHLERTAERAAAADVIARRDAEIRALQDIVPADRAGAALKLLLASSTKADPG